MKFQPATFSYIFALNQPTREEDLEIIRDFYSGDVSELVGYWEGQEERSYQIEAEGTDYGDMVNVLKFCDQDAYITVDAKGVAWLTTFSSSARDCYMPLASKLGTMTQIPAKEDCCTYCPSTQTYWVANESPHWVKDTH